MKARYYDEALRELKMGTSRDELAESLEVSFSAIIKEAGEWRPLADHIINLMVLAVKRSE
jgi:hypothetical protein